MPLSSEPKRVGVMKNKSLGLLLLALASSSLMFAPRGGKGGSTGAAKDGDSARAQAQRRCCWKLCMRGTAMALKQIEREAIETPGGISFERVGQIFMESFSDAVFVGTLMMTRADLGEGGFLPDDARSVESINPALKEHLEGQIITLMQTYEITPDHVDLYAAEGTLAAKKAAITPRLLTAIATCVTTFCANRPEQALAIANEFKIISNIHSNAEDAENYEPIMAGIAQCFYNNLTKVPVLAATANMGVSSRSLISVRSTLSSSGLPGPRGKDGEVDTVAVSVDIDRKY